MTNLEILRRGVLSWIIQWARCNHNGPQKRDEGGVQRGGDIMMQAETAVTLSEDQRGATSQGI